MLQADADPAMLKDASATAVKTIAKARPLLGDLLRTFRNMALLLPPSGLDDGCRGKAPKPLTFLGCGKLLIRLASVALLISAQGSPVRGRP
jgi:hypothetical protein